MDGDVAPLGEIGALAEAHDALVLIDDCHASGFFGPSGRGTDEFHGQGPDRVHILNSTLGYPSPSPSQALSLPIQLDQGIVGTGKALGGAMGGYTAGPQPLIDLLRQRSRPYLFSNSLAPPVVASAAEVRSFIPLPEAAGTWKRNRQAVEMLMESPMAGSLLEKTALFRGEMAAAGFSVLGNPAHPICPVMLGDAKSASLLL